MAGAASSATAPSVVLTVPTAGHHTYRHGAVPRKTRDVAGVRALVSTPAVPGAAAQAARASTRKAPPLRRRTDGRRADRGRRDHRPAEGLPGVHGQPVGHRVDHVAGRQVFSDDPAAMAPGPPDPLRRTGHRWRDLERRSSPSTATGPRSAPPSCTQGDTQIPYPTGGVLSGVWYDMRAPQESASPTGHQLAAEAEAAATHFGNTDQASNRNTQYVIVSPTGTNPDGWSSPTTGYCAYHDDTHDPTIDGGGPVAGPDRGLHQPALRPRRRGQLRRGHRQLARSPRRGHRGGQPRVRRDDDRPVPRDARRPAAGPTTSGQENGDKCAYVSSGPGAMFNLTLTTGMVTVQGTWSNRAATCADGEANFVYSPSITSFSPADGRRRLLGDDHRGQPGRRHRGHLRGDTGDRHRRHHDRR